MKKETPRQLTTKEVLKYIGEKVSRAKFAAPTSSNPMYYAGLIDGMLEIEEFILNVNAAFKQVAVYTADVECDLCGTEFTAEMDPHEMKATCPVCQNKIDLRD